MTVNGFAVTNSDATRRHGLDKTGGYFALRSTYETDLGWQFGENDDHPWKIDSNKNDGYPYLYWRE
ncbi:MAG: hypothetical protein LBI57_08100 [Helicobacteraceae bacterium]|jgi:hypothetical protein|nr:hypothetical protein [Helicobacteraceae bacterium]